ncbi:Hypothetical protein D9617_1g082410 [Elsinoe fawcettii]|nr:Hypothetical protein D9617_1g082410 [Elsinoe fawcettii]
MDMTSRPTSTGSCFDGLWPCETIPRSIPTPTATELCNVPDPTVSPAMDGSMPAYQWPIAQSVKGFVCITPPKGKYSAAERLKKCCSGSLTSVTNVTQPKDISYPATCVSWCLVNATSALPPIPEGDQMPADDLFKCMNPDPEDWEHSNGYVFSKQDSDLLCDFVNDVDAKKEWQSVYDERISMIKDADKSLSGNWAKPTGAVSNSSSTNSSTSTTETWSSRLPFATAPKDATGSVFAASTQTATAGSSTGSASRTASAGAILMVLPLIFSAMVLSL